MGSDLLTLHAEPRTLLGRRAKRVRAAQQIPAVLYGHDVPSRSIAVPAAAFLHIERMAGESDLITLTVGDDAPHRVLLQAVARDPVTSAPIHVDFRAVSMTETITTHIALRFTGEAPVLQHGGVLVKHLDRITAEALPSDLVHEIPVELGALTALDSVIHIRDLVVPSGITIRDGADDIVVSVTTIAVEQEAPAVAPPVAEVEVAKKGKGEEVPAKGEGGAKA